MNVETLAKEALQNYEQATREGDTRPYWKAKENAPDWLREMSFVAHDDMMPDDWKYEFIVAALDALESNDGDLDEAMDTIEPDLMTSELTHWLGSNTTRLGMVDEARAELGGGDSILDEIAMGQLQERKQVLQFVFDFLDSRADELNAIEEETATNLAAEEEAEGRKAQGERE